jgi:hypothetical protein
MRFIDLHSAVLQRRPNRKPYYDQTGEVTVEEGQVHPGPRARLAFPLDLGTAVCVSLGARLPPGARSGTVWLRLSDAPHQARVALRLRRGGAFVRNQPQPADSTVWRAGPGPSRGQPVWQLRWVLHEGLVHSRAWPKGEAEPTDWPRRRPSGYTGWQPTLLEIGAGPCGAVLEALEVATSPRVEAPAAGNPESNRSLHPVRRLLRALGRAAAARSWCRGGVPPDGAGLKNSVAAAVLLS